jgi:hypothetical protein
LAILTNVTLASTSNALPDDGATAPKHVGAVLMSILMYILKLFLRQLVHQLVNKKNFDNIKMHGMYVKPNEVYRQTRHFHAIQQSATYFGSSEPSSGPFVPKV